MLPRDFHSGEHAGQELSAAVGSEDGGWPNEVYIGMREFVTGRILRTPEWTYAVAAPKRPGWKAAERSDSYVEYMLYDNKADPFQHTNLAGFTRQSRFPSNYGNA